MKSFRHWHGGDRYIWGGSSSRVEQAHYHYRTPTKAYTNLLDQKDPNGINYSHVIYKIKLVQKVIQKLVARPRKVRKRLIVTVGKANACIEDVELRNFVEERTKIRRNLGLAICYKPTDKNIPEASHVKPEDKQVTNWSPRKGGLH